MAEPTDADVEPGLRAALGLIPNFDTLGDETLASFREALAGAPVEPFTDGEITVEWVTAVGADGHKVPCILHRPRALEHCPAILNIHGGGFVLGDAAREEPAMRLLSAVLGCAVLSVDYRLAPENPYPAALDDCTAALQWMHAQSEHLKIDQSRIAVRGVSAGGGLAAGLMMRACQKAVVRPCLLMLVYPMLDDRGSPPDRTGRHVWTRNANRYAWAAYLGSHAGAPPNDAAPGRSEDLRDMPPTFLAVGDIDLFLQENLKFATRLAQAKVPLEFHVYPGAYHGFNLVPDSVLSAAFARDCESALRRAFFNANPEIL
jgi:acetyl esterase/lipase